MRTALASFREGARQAARRLRTAAAIRLLRRVRIEECPAWAGEALDIKVPHGVQPNPQPTSAGSANINILFHLIGQTLDVPGDLAECGVYRGATLLPTGLFLKPRGLDRTLFGFDSFAGFDDSITIDLGLGGAGCDHKKRGGMSQTSQDAVWHKAERLELADTIRLEPGYFEESLPRVAERRFSFVHLDCDIYQSYKTCLDFFYPRLATGAIVLLDEYNDPPWPGCNKAVDEFLAGKPEVLEECASDNFRKWYFRKQ